MIEAKIGLIIDFRFDIDAHFDGRQYFLEVFEIIKIGKGLGGLCQLWQDSNGLAVLQRCLDVFGKPFTDSAIQFFEFAGMPNFCQLTANRKDQQPIFLLLG